jgi:hypothetical protein
MPEYRLRKVTGSLGAWYEIRYCGAVLVQQSQCCCWRSIAARIGWEGEWRLGQIVTFKALLSILDLRNRGVGDSDKVVLW